MVKPVKNPKEKLVLSEKERRFCEAYMGEACGNLADTMRISGLMPHVPELGSPEHAADPRARSRACTTASRILRKPQVRAYIEATAEGDPAVATRWERQAFWTEVMNDTTAKHADRIKAAEILGKACGDFVTKVEHSGSISPFANVDLSVLEEDEIDFLLKILEKLGVSIS